MRKVSVSANTYLAGEEATLEANRATPNRSVTAKADVKRVRSIRSSRVFSFTGMNRDAKMK
jgi:hypothetical protein